MDIVLCPKHYGGKIRLPPMKLPSKQKKLDQKRRQLLDAAFKKASDAKEKGNTFFKNKNFPQALKHYQIVPKC